MNSPQRSQEAQEATPRWIEVLAPSYKIQAPSRRSCEAAWVKRMREGQLAAKDLTSE
jgi:hypothetical protein